DSSAVVALLIKQSRSKEVTELRRRDPGMVVWWGTLLECRSALSRLRRELELDVPRVLQAGDELSRLSRNWTEVDPADMVRAHAVELVDRYPLKAADALQLASALLVIGNE